MQRVRELISNLTNEKVANIIFTHNVHFSNDDYDLKGACICTGAQTTSIGIK